MEPYEQETSPFSLGTTPVYNKLLEIFSNATPEFDTIVLNLGTILRNCASNKSVMEAKQEDKRLGRKSSTPAHILIKEAKDEILKFTESICEMMENSQGVLFPSIVVYFVNYRKCIPEAFYRPYTESEREMALAESMLQGVIHGSKKDGKFKRVNFIEYPISSSLCPHRLLSKSIAPMKSNHHVIMISNHRLDYHLHRFCTKFTILDSYTGNLLTAKDLPKKVFGTEVIPFTTTTHAILGDKDDIKPSIVGKEKTKLIEIATKDRWLAHSDEYIKIALRNLKVNVPFEI